MTEAILKHREARAGERGLFPVDDEGAALLGKIKPGKDVGCDIVQHRHPRHHRLYWGGLVRFLLEHSPMWEGAFKDDVSDALKIATGLVRRMIDPADGKTHLIPRSIKFAKMDQTKFNEFFDNAVQVICNRWMPPGVTPEAVRKELLEMVDGPGSAGHRYREQQRAGVA